jgi:CheY-like chemotaxis protein
MPNCSSANSADPTSICILPLPPLPSEMIVLYIDDDPEDRDLFEGAVANISPYHNVLYANGGQHAFQILEQFLPDYIFLDINMPAMDGKAFLKEIKKMTGLKTVPIIMFSTSSEATDQEECKALGALDFITKPTMFPDLCRVLKKYL